MLRHHGERFLAAGRGLEEKAFGCEHHFQQLSVVVLIVHDQNACGVVRDIGLRVHVRAS